MKSLGARLVPCYFWLSLSTAWAGEHDVNFEFLWYMAGITGILEVFKQEGGFVKSWRKACAILFWAVSVHGVGWLA